MTRRYTFGALDKHNTDATTTVVEADDYELSEGFVTFTRSGRKFLSLPYSKVGVIAELTEDNQLPISPANNTP